MGWLSNFFGGGGSEQSSQSSSQQEVFGPQANAYSYLFPQGQQLAQQQMPQAQQLAPQLAGQLGGQGQAFLGQLAGQNPFLQGLSQFNNEVQVQGQVDQFGQDVQTQLDRMNMSAGQQQSLSGNRGGGRHGVAQGLLGEAALQEFGRGARDIRRSGQQDQLSALQSGAGIQGQSAAAGLNALPGMFDMGLGGLSGQFSPLQSLAGLAPPITLTDSQSSSTGQTQGAGAGQAAAGGFGRGFGNAFGSFIF